MLTKLLSKDDKTRFLLFAELLSLADKPMLWDGKKKEDITSHTNKENLSIKKGEPESMLLTEWGWQGSVPKNLPDIMKAKKMPGATWIEQCLIEFLRDILYKNTEEPVARWNAVAAVLSTLLKTDAITNKYAIRIVLYELMLLALADGAISPVEYLFLEKFKNHHQIDNYTFDEIRERAESMYRETQKTIAIVLE
jgi:hypothetical protein